MRCVNENVLEDRRAESGRVVSLQCARPCGTPSLFSIRVVFFLDFRLHTIEATDSAYYSHVLRCAVCGVRNIIDRVNRIIIDITAYDRTRGRVP